jgi:hypothetical protein
MKKLLLLFLFVPIIGFSQTEDIWNRPDSVEARHIMLTKENFTSDSAKIILKNLKEKVQNGADFGHLATQFSECPSAIKRGDLGWFSEGQMVSEFNDVCFTSRTGDLKIVSTVFGVHLIQITNVSRNIVPDIQVELIRSMYLECLSLEKRTNKENCDSIAFSEYEFDVGGTDTKWSQERWRTVEDCYFDKGYSKITFYKADLWKSTLAEFYFRYNRLFFAYTRINFEVEYGDPSQFEPDFSEPEPLEYYFYNDIFFNNNLLSSEKSSNLVAVEKYNLGNEDIVQEMLNKAQSYLIKHGNKSIVFEGSFEYDPENISEVTVSIKENFGIETVILNSVCDLIKEKERVNNILVERYNTNGFFTVSEIESIINLKDYFNMFEIKMLSNTYYDKNIPNKKECNMFKRAMGRYNQFSNLKPFLISIL